MSCPTCDHTIETIYADLNQTIRHCPRCGTVVKNRLGHTDVYVPKLVERCRQFEPWLAGVDRTPEARLTAWRSLGMRESIWPPDQRPAAE